MMAAKKLEGYALHARDGSIGEVDDLYFDDQDWRIRYAVVSTGSWMEGRRVLIGAEVLGAPDESQHRLPVDLSIDQVRKSPGVETDQPVSRQREAELRQHYGWPPYWGAIFAEGGVAAPLVMPTPPPAEPRRGLTDGQRPPAKGDPRLRSTNDTTGYHIEASDGPIGHLDDLLVDTAAWRIRYLIVGTRNWLPGRKVLLSPEWIRKVSWEKSSVVVDQTRDEIKQSPPYDPSATWNDEYAGQLHDYYRRPRFADLEPAPKLRDDHPNRPEP